MLTSPMDILTMFPVRKSKKQKQAFLDAVQSYAESLGYACHVESGSLGAKNLVIGNPENGKYLITAHYDTCAGMLVPNLITPCSLPLFLLYQIAVVMGIVICAVIPGILVGWMSGNESLGSLVTSSICWISIGLMMFGPANPNNANDNTSGVVTVLEIARSMPENLRDKACFVLFDLEEIGLVGSASYRKKHKSATDHQLVINLDCVGDGDHMLFFPTSKLKKNKEKIRPIYKCCGYFGEKSLLVRDKGFSVYPSDQANFPYGVGVAALRKSKLGLYLGRIHTSRDTILEETNVNILRAAIISMIACDAVK